MTVKLSLSVQNPTEDPPKPPRQNAVVQNLDIDLFEVHTQELCVIPQEKEALRTKLAFVLGTL